MSTASVGSLCFIKSSINAAVFQNLLEHYMPVQQASFMGMRTSSSARQHLPTQLKVQNSGSATIGLLCLIGPQTDLT